MTADPEGPATPPVGVTYYGPYFALTVLWTLEPGDTDEETIAAAAIWFTTHYGFDPREHATKTTVAPVPN
jgi:hypothetical protein